MLTIDSKAVRVASRRRFFSILFGKSKSITRAGNVTIKIHPKIPTKGKDNMVLFGHASVILPRGKSIKTTFSQA